MCFVPNKLICIVLLYCSIMIITFNLHHKNYKENSNVLKSHHNSQPGPSCSKLTMSLVNDLLKFTSSDTQIR